MSYVRAEDVLPEELIEAIQQYISGKVYIFHVKRKSIQRIIRAADFTDDIAQ